MALSGAVVQPENENAASVAVSKNSGVIIFLVISVSLVVYSSY
jgi:hypothetical protein